MLWLYRYQMSMFQLAAEQHKLAVQAASVIAARCAEMGAGAMKPTEAITMVWEKPLAAAEASLSAFRAINRKANGIEIVRSALKPYAKRTGSNARRLGRKK